MIVVSFLLLYSMKANTGVVPSLKANYEGVYKSFRASLLWFLRKVAPYLIQSQRKMQEKRTSDRLTLYRTNGIGMKAMLMKASVLLAQPTPRSLYMAAAEDTKSDSTRLV